MRPRQIGRFEVMGDLGAGAQGSVYLVRDPQLDRRVALKTLTHQGLADPERQEALMREARIMGRFKHPNIVPVFEAGQFDDGVFLVLEYVEGETLAAVLKRGPLPIERAITLMLEVLDGVAAAHAEGILHRDLKPSNILIGSDGRARLTDFGIAMPVSAVSESNRMWGSLPYLSPEQVTGQSVTARSDVFALGLVWFEMLTGQRAFSADSAEAIIYQVANMELDPASRLTGDGDERFDQLIVRATRKEPTERYADAGEFRDAFKRLLDVGRDSVSGEGALDFLMRRIKRKPDFPGMSRIIQEISHLANADSERSVSELANAVLKDFAVTQKLLRLSNSSYYGQFGAGIHTVSRAIVVLGFDQVKSAALGLILFENLKNARDSAKLMALLVEALYSGMLARSLAAKHPSVDTEQAFICALFHTLGKMLALYYFPEEAADIDLLCQQQGMSEATAASEVLGVSYFRLAQAVLREWNFPREIVDTVEPMPDGGSIPKAKTAAAAMHQITTFSNALAKTVTGNSGAELEKGMDRLHERYDQSLGLERESMDELVQTSKRQLDAFLSAVKLPRQARDHLMRLEQNLGAEEVEQTVSAMLDDTLDRELDAAQANPVPTPEAQAGALMEGIGDISEALLGNFDLNGLLQSVLETMYRGMGLQRIMLMLPARGGEFLGTRFALGEEVETLVGRFELPAREQQSVVSLAMTSQKDIVVTDSHDAKIARYVPKALTDVLDARSFLLLPLVVQGRSIGLFLLQLHAGEEVGERVLKALKALRNQTALAIQQARG